MYLRKQFVLYFISKTAQGILKYELIVKIPQ